MTVFDPLRREILPELEQQYRGEPLTNGTFTCTISGVYFISYHISAKSRVSPTSCFTLNWEANRTIFLSSVLSFPLCIQWVSFIYSLRACLWFHCCPTLTYTKTNINKVWGVDLCLSITRCAWSSWRAPTWWWQTAIHLRVFWLPPAQRSWGCRSETRCHCKPPGSTPLWVRPAPATPSPASWSTPQPEAPDASEPLLSFMVLGKGWNARVEMIWFDFSHNKVIHMWHVCLEAHFHASKM